MVTQTTTQSTVIACDLGAIPPDERDAHMTRAAHLLFTAFQERHEVEHGFVWRFAIDQYDQLRRYIDLERRCCPFFTFELEVAAQRSALWLRITGGAEIKAFLRSELDHYGALVAAPGTSDPLAAEPVIVCNRTALGDGEEEALTVLSKRLLFALCEERVELADGYAWRYHADHYDDLCRFIEADSRCCAFFTHTLEVTPQHGPLWLRITGPADVKAALHTELERLESELHAPPPSAEPA